uniref:Uncharacterized protein n=1 Tax=Moniliophthora roreri TaxID=221103 RepID=A0A0W0FIQ9_MONRR
MTRYFKIPQGMNGELKKECGELSHLMVHATLFSSSSESLHPSDISGHLKKNKTTHDTLAPEEHVNVMKAWVVGLLELGRVYGVGPVRAES